jgi:anti-sigma factor RsiW
MSCEMETELTAYLDGELAPAEAAAVRAHLAGCERCRATEALLRRTVATLRSLPNFEPSRAFRRQVLGQVEAAPLPFRSRLAAAFRPALVVPSAAGLLAASVVAVLLWGPGPAALPPELGDGVALGVALHYDVVADADYDLLGLDSPDDLEVVEHLQELEGRP